MAELSPYDKSRAINYARYAESHKESKINQLRADYARNMVYSLEYEPDAIINGETRRIIAAKTKGNQRYKISSHPDETFHAGDIVECYGSHWIIIEVESNKDICTTGVMLRCNHLFRFQNGTSEIIERWGVLDTGVYSTTVKDTETQTELNKQYKIYLPLDDETRKLYIGKRLATSVMKDSSYDDVLVCWRTTEFDDSSENYGDDALLILKCISDQYHVGIDNIEERICDYIAPNDTPPVLSAYNGTIACSGSPTVRIGGSGKTFVAECATLSGEVVSGNDFIWGLVDAPVGVTIEPNNNYCKVVVRDAVEDGSQFLLTVRITVEEAIVESSILVEAVGL